MIRRVQAPYGFYVDGTRPGVKAGTCGTVLADNGAVLVVVFDGETKSREVPASWLEAATEVRR